MNGLELDKAVREILGNVTAETSLSATRKLADLGFGVRASWEIVCRVIEERVAVPAAPQEPK